VSAPSRVLFVCHSREIGGSELYLEQMARRMAGIADVRVVCRPDPVMDEWADRVAGHGAGVVRVALPGRSGLARLRREIRWASVTHLVLASRVGAYQALVTLACRLERRPLVCTHQLARETEDLPLGALGRHLRALALRTVYGGARMHVAVSAEGLELLHGRVGLDRRRTVEIGNGVDLERFAPPGPGAPPRPGPSLAEGIDEGAPLCVTVARLSPQKGLEVLIDAAAILRDRYPERRARLVVVGEGELRAELEARIAARQVGAMVRLVGARPPDEIPAWLAAADLFVLSSHYEGMSLAVMEAMAAGCPPVVTRVSGTAELVPDADHGRVVAPGDAEGLAGAIAELLADPGLRRRIGERARAHARAFSWDACFTRTSAVLREAAGGR
jgi:glycosyltransferase involved in cell wall biosynthesis